MYVHHVHARCLQRAGEAIRSLDREIEMVVNHRCSTRATVVTTEPSPWPLVVPFLMSRLVLPFLKPGLMAYAYNLALRRQRQDYHEFKTSLSYTMKPCLKNIKRKPSIVVHAFSPSTGGVRSLSLRSAWSAEWAPDQSELHRDTCLKN